MKVNEIKEHSTEELQNLLEELRRRLFDLRSQAVTEKLEDPTQLGKTKKDIARILTTLRSRDVQDLEAKMHHLEKAHTAAHKK